MLHWLRGDEDQGEQDDRARLQAINALYQYVRDISAHLYDIKNNLDEAYSPEGLSLLGRSFEKISKDFSDFTIKRHHMFHDVIRGSRERTTATTRIAAQASTIARLFEQYSRRHRSYSAVKSRLAIDRLLAELENLETNCAATGATG